MTNKNISIVIVSFNMNRELHRTLYSLSNGYQNFKGEIEIIVVDTGSALPPKPEDFHSLGLNISVINTLTPYSSSPVKAINHGISLTNFDLVGVFIDGARLATPGMLNSCSQASHIYKNGILTTRNYQLGPDLQYRSLDNGYTKEIEDALLESISWKTNGYKLFEISTPEKCSHVSEPLLESNALFMRKRIWETLGGYDPLFISAGGGLANPDLLKRACELPESILVRLDGEATFHQIHHGVSTSSSISAFTNLKEASIEYHKIRGFPFRPIKLEGIQFKYKQPLSTTPDS